MSREFVVRHQGIGGSFGFNTFFKTWRISFFDVTDIHVISELGSFLNLKKSYVHKMSSIKSTITRGAFDISRIVHHVVFFVDFGGMKLFGVSAFNLTVSWVNLCQLVVVVSPQVAWLQRVDVSVALENAVFVNVFHLKSRLKITSSLGFAWTCLVRCIGWLPSTGYLRISRPLALRKVFFLLLISSTVKVSRIKVLPLSIEI